VVLLPSIHQIKIAKVIRPQPANSPMKSRTVAKGRNGLAARAVGCSEMKKKKKYHRVEEKLKHFRNLKGLHTANEKHRNKKNRTSPKTTPRLGRRFPLSTDIARRKTHLKTTSGGRPARPAGTEGWEREPFKGKGRNSPNFDSPISTDPLWHANTRTQNRKKSLPTA